MIIYVAVALGLTLAASIYQSSFLMTLLVVWTIGGLVLIQD